MSIFKYGLLCGLLAWTMATKGQRVEIRYDGQEPLWLSELYHFVWDKTIPLRFESGKTVYDVPRAPKVFRLATRTGFSSWFFVGEKDRVTVTVLSSDPLNIKVEGDVAGMYYYALDEVAREYTRAKLEMADDYMKAWSDKDEVLASRVRQRVERLRARRDSAYENVIDRAVSRGCARDVLVYANMPLGLKFEVAQRLKEEGKASGRMLEELDLYAKIYTPAYVYYYYYYPYVWQEQLNSLASGQEERERLMGEVGRIMRQEFYNVVCNRLEDERALEDLIEYSWSVSDFEHCLGLHMELDDRAKRDTALNKLSGRMERMYLTRSGKVMSDFSAKTPGGETVRLSDYRGQYVLLDFWASWCAPCRGLMPKMKMLYEKYYSTGKFNIVGVSKDKDREKWLKAVEEEDMPWNNILASETIVNEPAQFESVTGLPQLLLVDPEGRVVLNVSGSDNMDRVVEMLGQLLGK